MISARSQEGMRCFKIYSGQVDKGDHSGGLSHHGHDGSGRNQGSFNKGASWRQKHTPHCPVSPNERLGEKDFTTRRSMVFARHLRIVGDEFRANFLESNDEDDKTVFNEDWTKAKQKPSAPLGGPYLGVHLRRKDFIWGHRDDVPSLRRATEEIHSLLKKLKLKKVFIATDADRQGKYLEELRRLIPEMVRFEPTWEELELYKDGGVAIIDQWICAHARYFIGTSVSTFSFRIHEEREILGFDPKTTYNRFCGDKEKNCEQPTHWKIVY
ncbi:unnamed protein product [Ranitomeya imitator]|uniref:GDP-fucose protein O-fucosyltransferase 2 n=1 Tax=Ranitomeya imitator TaxID=111125 RepID=A0ABN9ME23_9NEOB|nr:unnamed protein product [Ranitomeya imitator]